MNYFLLTQRSKAMETIQPLFDHFLWWEEHQDKLDPYDSDNHDWIYNLKKQFHKECVALYTADPSGFLLLCQTEEFSEQIDLYGLCPHVDDVLVGRHGKFLTKYYNQDDGEIKYSGKKYRITWRGVFTCDMDIY